MAAIAIIGAGALSAGASIYGASSAADAQTSAADSANARLTAQQAQTRGDLLPYQAAGQNALTQQLGMAQKGFSFDPTMSELEKTPGYQFNLAQGEKAVQNSASARGLGISGAAQKGAANFASGLAANTYQQQFGNALTKYTTNINALGGISGLGENAAAQTGNQGTQIAGSIGNNITGAGNAQAAAYMSASNSVGGAANNALGAYLYGSKNNLFASSPLNIHPGDI